MIDDVAGDLPLSKAAAIAHEVVPNNNFANGLTLALREWSGVGVGNIRIVNLLTPEAPPSHGSKPGKASVVWRCQNLRPAWADWIRRM